MLRRGVVTAFRGCWTKPYSATTRSDVAEFFQSALDAASTTLMRELPAPRVPLRFQARSLSRERDTSVTTLDTLTIGDDGHFVFSRRRVERESAAHTDSRTASTQLVPGTWTRSRDGRAILLLPEAGWRASVASAPQLPAQLCLRSLAAGNLVETQSNASFLTQRKVLAQDRETGKLESTTPAYHLVEDAAQHFRRQVATVLDAKPAPIVPDWVTDLAAAHPAYEPFAAPGNDAPKHRAGASSTSAPDATPSERRDDASSQQECWRPVDVQAKSASPSPRARAADATVSVSAAAAPAAAPKPQATGGLQRAVYGAPLQPAAPTRFTISEEELELLRNPTADRGARDRLAATIRARSA